MPLAILLLQTQRFRNFLKYAIQTVLNHWFTKFSPSQYLVATAAQSTHIYTYQDMTHVCSVFNYNHSPRTSYSPRTNS